MKKQREMASQSITRQTLCDQPIVDEKQAYSTFDLLRLSRCDKQSALRQWDACKWVNFSH